MNSDIDWTEAGSLPPRRIREALRLEGNIYEATELGSRHTTRRKRNWKVLTSVCNEFNDSRRTRRWTNTTILVQVTRLFYLRCGTDPRPVRAHRGTTQALERSTGIRTETDCTRSRLPLVRAWLQKIRNSTTHHKGVGNDDRLAVNDLSCTCVTPFETYPRGQRPGNIALPPDSEVGHLLHSDTRPSRTSRADAITPIEERPSCQR